MPLPPRNAPCPCGSGRKYKKCCGEDRSFARAQQDREEEREAVLARLGVLAGWSPRMIPLVDGVEDWAQGVLTGGMLPGDALAAVPEREAVRLVETLAELFPRELAEAEGLCAHERVVAAILLGAIVAARDDHELLAVPPECLEAIEDGEMHYADPIEALAATFESWQLWSRAEGAVADAEVAAIPDWLDDEAADARFEEILAEVTSRLYGEWHARRVERMVHKVRQQLPFAGYPRASQILADGCARFDAEPELGKRIAQSLLIDAMPFEPPVPRYGLEERWAA